jgi:Superinfection immunity protein
MSSKLRSLVLVAVAAISLNSITANARINSLPDRWIEISEQILAQQDANVALVVGLSLLKGPTFEPHSSDFEIGYPRMYRWPFDGMYIVLVIFYFVPPIVASSLKHPNEEAIGVVNLHLGWTIIGWIACLIWAIRHPAAPNKRL